MNTKLDVWFESFCVQCSAMVISVSPRFGVDVCIMNMYVVCIWLSVNKLRIDLSTVLKFKFNMLQMKWKSPNLQIGPVIY